MNKTGVSKPLLGLTTSLRNIGEDGNENVTWKVKSRCFKLYRTCSMSFNLVQFAKCWQNWSWILKDCSEVQESRCLMFTSHTKREIRHFHVVVVQAKKLMYKKAWCTCKLFFCQSKPIAFCRSRCPCRGRCLSFLILPLEKEWTLYVEL